MKLTDSLGAWNSSNLQDASSASVSLTRPVTALAALALLTCLAPLPPPAQAATCEPGQSGILNPQQHLQPGNGGPAQ